MGLEEFLPPEVRGVMEEQYNHRRMHQQAFAHEVKQFLDSLDMDQLDTLDSMLLASSASDKNAYHWRGQITMLRQEKFDICPCGESHEIPDSLQMSDGFEGRENSREVDKCQLDLVEYGCDINPEDQDGRSIVCLGCGTVYQSLEDRMLRPPGVKGCSPCQQKAKFG